MKVGTINFVEVWRPRSINLNFLYFAIYEIQIQREGTVTWKILNAIKVKSKM